MAYEEALRTITLDAAASIAEATGVPGTAGSSEPNSGKQYRFVKVTGAHQAGLATAAANERVIGVLQNKPQGPGHAATIAIDGVSLVQAGGTVAAGDPIGVHTATGQGVTVADGAAYVGIALSGAASGQLFSCLLV